jgi:hypothetical protein
MFRHIALIVSLTLVAIAAGVAMVPGEREQWTMLVRDGRNQEALAALEALYRAGRRNTDAVLHLYKLYMAVGEIELATRVLRDFVADHASDPATVTLLARHYGDIQNKTAEIDTLERLFELAPSLPTAGELLTYYRLEGAFDREQSLLQTLLARQMITANDAERLGLMLAARGDLYGAREALTRFDEIANPERAIGRLALFDVMVQLDDKAAAFEKAAVWIGSWRRSSMHRAALVNPAARLVRMMLAVDEPATRKLICDAQRADEARRAAQQVDCAIPELDAEGEGAANTASTFEPPRDRGRRRAK